MGAISYQLKTRWKSSPIPTLFVVASRPAMNRFGGHGGRVPIGTHRTHDLHLSTVFLLLRSRSPLEAEHWLTEERIRRTQSDQSEKLPDAIIDIESRRRVIEFGGSYPKKKLEMFHAYCCSKNLPYEVW